MEQTLQDIKRLLVTQYKTLCNFSFSKNCFASGDGINQGDLELTMMNRDGACIHLRFHGVRNLEIRTGPFDEISIVGLVFDDMSDDQWPNVKLRVTSEDVRTHLSFYCQEVDVVSK